MCTSASLFLLFAILQFLMIIAFWGGSMVGSVELTKLKSRTSENVFFPHTILWKWIRDKKRRPPGQAFDRDGEKLAIGNKLKKYVDNTTEK